VILEYHTTTQVHRL